MNNLVPEPDAERVLGDSMAGIEFRLRQLIDPLLAMVPTIVITASDVSAEDRAPLHAEGWLEKPFRFDTLLELVKRYVIAEGAGLLAAE